MRRSGLFLLPEKPHQNGMLWLVLSMSISVICRLRPVVEVKDFTGQLPLLGSCAGLLPGFLAAWVGGGCRTWKETWTACWLTDEVEVGGGWKLRLAVFFFFDHRDWLTQFPVQHQFLLVSPECFFFPCSPQPGVIINSYQVCLVLLDSVQRAVTKLLFLSAVSSHLPHY